jgi:acyl carrier protein
MARHNGSVARRPMTSQAKPRHGTAAKNQNPRKQKTSEELMSDVIEQKVREIISTQLEIAIDKVKPESRFIDDLKADSLAVVELVLALEDNFNIEIPDEDTEQIKSVGDAISYIKTHQKHGAAHSHKPGESHTHKPGESHTHKK